MASVLTTKNTASVARIRVTIPASLMSEIDDIQRRAGAQGLALDVSSICASALARAVKQARTELGRPAGQSDG